MTGSVVLADDAVIVFLTLLWLERTRRDEEEQRKWKANNLYVMLRHPSDFRSTKK